MHNSSACESIQILKLFDAVQNNKTIHWLVVQCLVTGYQYFFGYSVWWHFWVPSYNGFYYFQLLYGTPLFPPDSCYLSGAPCQMIVRCLPDAPPDICEDCGPAMYWLDYCCRMCLTILHDPHRCLMGISDHKYTESDNCRLKVFSVIFSPNLHIGNHLNMSPLTPLPQWIIYMYH